jgi:hypothetical protein
MIAPRTLLMTAVLAVALAQGQSNPSISRTVVIPRATLRLKAHFWKPSGPGSVPDEQPTAPGVSISELRRLRPAVERDLRAVLNRVWNVDKPTAADVENEFLQCRFTPLKLGSLGPAILVEDNSDGGRNSLMLNIYVPRHGLYRPLIKEAGTGPIFLPGPGSVPDIVFGTAGVCYSLSRYRYISGKYQIDACIRREQDTRGNCVVKSCGKRSFPDPYNADDSGGDSPAPSPYIAGPGRTGKQIMSGKE